jgi:hypothetical protein
MKYTYTKVDSDDVFTGIYNSQEVNTIKYTQYPVNEVGQCLIDFNDTSEKLRTIISSTTQLTTNRLLRRVLDFKFTELIPVEQPTETNNDTAEAIQLEELETTNSLLESNNSILEDRVKKLQSENDTLRTLNDALLTRNSANIESGEEV